MDKEEIPAAEHSAAGIVDLMHQTAEGHKSMQGGVGKVIAPPPDIQIFWNGITLSKEQIYINEYWLAGHRREAKGTIVSGTQAASCAVGAPHTHPINNAYTDDIIYTDTLKVGDWVTVFPVENEKEGDDEGNQLFMVTAKMVKL